MIDEVLRKRRREAVALGEREVVALFEKDGQTVTTAHLDKVANFFNFHKREEFFYAVGSKVIALPDSFKKLIQEGDKGNFFTRMFRTSKSNKSNGKTSKEESTSIGINTKKPFLLEEFNFTPNYEIATCCNPILGDETIGFVEEGNRVIVHKRSCTNATRLKSSAGNRIVQTLWGDHPNSLFEATFDIKGIDSIGILNAIIQYISEDINISITGINLSSHSGVFGGTFKVMVHSTDDIRRICDGLKKNPSINSITRI
ncbi:ACT domain-containing protein [Porphyromonas gingivicanis]|nr:ACT domain-containing protein [Porphyromonas gingivicanis]